MPVKYIRSQNDLKPIKIRLSLKPLNATLANVTESFFLIKSKNTESEGSIFLKKQQKFNQIRFDVMEQIILVIIEPSDFKSLKLGEEYEMAFGYILDNDEEIRYITMNPYVFKLVASDVIA